MSNPVLVSFSNQAIELFERLQGIIGHYPLIFPLEKRCEECMNENIMQWWADFLDQSKNGGKFPPTKWQA
jgi:hypothetical protein